MKHVFVTWSAEAVKDVAGIVIGFVDDYDNDIEVANIPNIDMTNTVYVDSFDESVEERSPQQYYIEAYNIDNDTKVVVGQRMFCTADHISMNTQESARPGEEFVVNYVTSGNVDDIDVVVLPEGAAEIAKHQGYFIVSVNSATQAKEIFIRSQLLGYAPSSVTVTISGSAAEIS